MRRWNSEFGDQVTKKGPTFLRAISEGTVSRTWNSLDTLLIAEVRSVMDTAGRLVFVTGLVGDEQPRAMPEFPDRETHARRHTYTHANLTIFALTGAN